MTIQGISLYLQNLIESLRLDVNKQTKITTDKLSDLKIENKTVYLSSPDSTGKQYRLKKVLLLHPSRIRKEQKLMKHYPLLCSSSRIDLILLVIRLMILLNQKETVVELSWWDLHKDKVYIGINRFVYCWLDGI